jgi:hypothetical protein
MPLAQEEGIRENRERKGERKAEPMNEDSGFALYGMSKTEVAIVHHSNSVGRGFSASPNVGAPETGWSCPVPMTCLIPVLELCIVMDFDVAAL